MAFWDGLLSEDVGLYDDLLTAKQKTAINDPFSSRSLAAMSKAFADAARPSLTPGPGLGAALGNAAYMMSAGRDEAAQTLLKAGLTAQQIKDLQQTAQGKAALSQILQRMLAAQTPGTGGTTPGVVPPLAPAAPAPAATPPPVASPPPPPGSVPPSIGPGMGTGYTGLLGGDGTQMAGGLPPPDEYIPDPSRAGLFDVLQAAYSGGAGTPGLPFRAGADTGDAPTLRLASAPSGSSRDALLDTIARYESGGRNIMQGIVPPEGGYNPSVGRVTGPSTAQGPWQITNSTWRDAAPKAGVDTDKYPTAMSAPVDVQRTVAGQLLDERGLTPWAPYNRALASAVGYQGAPVRIQPLGGSAAPAGTPALPGLDASIPGTNMTPAQLSLLDAMAELNKLGNPFKGFLDAYYKTPGYQEQSAAAAARGRIGEEEPMQRRLKYLDLMIDMRKNGVIYDPQTGTVSTDPTYDALINRREEDKKQIELDYQKKLKAFEEGITIEKEKRGIVTAPILGVDGTTSEETMTGAERDRRLREQSMRPGQVRPGDIIPKPEARAEPGYALKRGPSGELTTAPITGSEAAEKAAAAARAKEISDKQLLIARDVVVHNVENIEKNLTTSKLPTTGLFGPLVSRFGGTGAGDIASSIATIEARSSLDALNLMRQQGGTLGQVTQGEHALLAAAIANLKQSQSEKQFRENLDIVKQHYIDAVHGPGAYNKYLAARAPAPSAAGGPAKPASEAEYNALPSGTQFVAPDGTTRIKP
jgi:hypothetical protein